MAPSSERDLTVTVTGPTGTFGFGLIPLLQADEHVTRVVGIALRPFDPAAYGWTKMDYRRGDVRDFAALHDAFSDADVVVHLAFLIVGAASGGDIEEINVRGTLNAFHAAAAAGVRRFVYASSVAGYGFHPDNPPTELSPPLTLPANSDCSRFHLPRVLCMSRPAPSRPCLSCRPLRSG